MELVNQATVLTVILRGLRPAEQLAVKAQLVDFAVAVAADTGYWFAPGFVQSVHGAPMPSMIRTAFRSGS